MRNSIHKRGMAILLSAFMLFQFLPGQLLGQIMNDKSIVANAASSSAAQNERDLYNYLSGRGYNRAVICGILSFFYNDNDSSGFSCSYSYLSSTVDTYLTNMEVSGWLTEQMSLRKVGQNDYKKMCNVPETKEGAYDAGYIFANYVLTTIRNNNEAIAVIPATLCAGVAANEFWPVYDPYSLETMIFPVPTRNLDSIQPIGEFGARGNLHAGFDVPADEGEKVIAVASGRVIHAYSECNTNGYNDGPDCYYEGINYGGRDGHGNNIIILHSNNYLTCYSHLSSVKVETGDIVTIGDEIGKVGNTGDSYGSHLHFEVRSGKPVYGMESAQNPRNHIGITRFEKYPGSRQLTYIESKNSYIQQYNNNNGYGTISL